MKTAQQWAEEYIDLIEDPDEVATLALMVEEIIAEREHIPGLYKCDKCGFELSLNKLHPEDMTVAVDHTQRDLACPNDGDLLRPFTWKENAAGLGEQVFKALAERKQMAAYYRLLFDELTICRTCGGKGKTMSADSCPDCDGSGRDLHGSNMAAIHLKIIEQRQQPTPQ